MMNKTVLKYCLLMLVLPFLWGCKKDTKLIDDDTFECVVEPIIGRENNIVGKWKLMKSYLPITNQTIDYSCSDIVYHFRADGTLLIIGTQSEYVARSSHYQLIHEPYVENVAPLTLEIGDQARGCTISKISMIHDSSPVDGGILTFLRVGR